MALDRIDLFRIFARVVECGSFTRAADALNVPRSSVSTAIRELESRVGSRLLHRTTRKVSPTQDGAAFYERCISVIADVEETEGMFRQSTAGPGGKIRIDVPGRIGRLIIAPALAEFLDRYPAINIELAITDRAVDLVADGVDCALRVGTLDDSSLVARHIGLLPLINVASPAYLQRYGTPHHPREMAAHFAVNYASPTTGRIEAWEWIENGEARTVSLRSRVTVNSAEAYIACCLAGLGLIQIPAYDVKQQLDGSQLIEIMPNHRAAPMPMTLLFPHRPHPSRRLQIFSDWLASILRRCLLS